MRAERVLVGKSSFVHARGVLVRAEIVLAARSFFVHTRGVSVRTERVLVARTLFVHARGMSVCAERLVVRSLFMRTDPVLMILSFVCVVQALIVSFQGKRRPFMRECCKFYDGVPMRKEVSAR